MKSPEELARQIFGERAAFYTASESHTDPQVLAKVVQYARAEQGWDALDIATGSGHTAFAISPLVSSVTGIDITREMLQEAERLKVERHADNVQFRTGDAHALPFEDDTFHLVTCRRAAHHFSNITLALGEIRRVLRAGGRVVIDDRSVPEDDFADACMNQLDTWHDESHVREYRPSDWRRMLAEAGFEVESIEPYVKRRPVTSLTDGVSEENTRKIHETLAALTAAQREVFDLVTKDGQLHINHWYVLIAAKKSAPFIR
jgi:ubiquinone/menaquinone biosynthesis C-methylase UbiE